MKSFWHKCLHWEYWPVWVVYAATSVLWVFKAITILNVKFYAKINPAIANGGLFNDRKSDIYQLLPSSVYPRTILVKANSDVQFNDFIETNGLKLPLIVKPDFGYRGIGVAKVETVEQLKKYHHQFQQDYLIQECIHWPNEMGLFYFRHPGQTKGVISGITGKHFFTLIGDGESSLKDLMMKNPRYAMQISKLQNSMDVTEVLEKGGSKCLVPFGNHNRGTMFTDESSLINSELTNLVNTWLSDIDGLYYGRLDIRYNSFEELCEGKNFSVIEFNGAKSEPTHIYDPKHSFIYGQKEIFKHQKMVFQIVDAVRKSNKK